MKNIHDRWSDDEKVVLPSLNRHVTPIKTSSIGEDGQSSWSSVSVAKRIS